MQQLARLRLTSRRAGGLSNREAIIASGLVFAIPLLLGIVADHFAAASLNAVFFAIMLAVGAVIAEVNVLMSRRQPVYAVFMLYLVGVVAIRFAPTGPVK